jgi:polyisoprenoid-binding protein YceI
MPTFAIQLAAMPRFFLSVPVLFLLFTSACSERMGTDEEYARVEEASSRLGNARMLVLVPDSSQVGWVIRHRSGQAFSGRFRPSKGSLVLEDENLVAGFLEGDLLKDSRPDPGQDSLAFLRPDSLLRYFPRLMASVSSPFRLDIRQVSRVVARSDFRQFTGLKAQEPTHQVQADLDLADSTVLVSIPVQVEAGAGAVRVSGDYSVNLRDFGLLTEVLPGGAQAPFDPVVQCRIDWRFRLWKKPGKPR